MTDIEERYADLIDDTDDSLPRRTLVADLDRFYTQPAPLALRASVQAALHTQPRLARHPARMHVPLARRLAAFVAALLLVLSGGTAYLLRAPAPTPVSAQEVLLRAAAAIAPVRDRVIHEITTNEASTQLTGHPVVYTPERTDTWIDVNGQGLIRRIADTTTDHTGIVASRVETDTAAGGTIVNYIGALGHSIEQLSRPSAHCVGAASTQASIIDVVSYHRLLVNAAHHTSGDLRLLAPRRLDGKTVTVVEDSTAPADIIPTKASGGPAPYREDTYYYIDPQTYVLRGSDTYHVTPDGKMTRTGYQRILLYETLPLSAVPVHSFDLHVPKGTPILPVTVIPVEPCPLSVTAAIALTPRVSLLLKGHPYGLRLDSIERLNLTILAPPMSQMSSCSGFGDNLTLVGSFADYRYQSRSSANPVTEDFCIAVSVSPHPSIAFPQIDYATPQAKAHSRIPLLKPSILHLTVAGQNVEASYHLTTREGNHGSNLLWFTLHGRTVAITGHQIDEHAFFGLVGGLVDAYTHPTIVEALQRDLKTR